MVQQVLRYSSSPQGTLVMLHCSYQFAYQGQHRISQSSRAVFRWGAGGATAPPDLKRNFFPRDTQQLQVQIIFFSIDSAGANY